MLRGRFVLNFSVHVNVMSVTEQQVSDPATVVGKTQEVAFHYIFQRRKSEFCIRLHLVVNHTDAYTGKRRTAPGSRHNIAGLTRPHLLFLLRLRPHKQPGKTDYTEYGPK